MIIGDQHMRRAYGDSMWGSQFTPQQVLTVAANNAVGPPAPGAAQAGPPAPGAAPASPATASPSAAAPSLLTQLSAATGIPPTGLMVGAGIVGLVVVMAIARR